MSRIGRLPVPVPSGVTVTIEPELVAVKGPLGELSEKIALDIIVEQQGEAVADEELALAGELVGLLVQVALQRPLRGGGGVLHDGGEASPIAVQVLRTATTAMSSVMGCDAKSRAASRRRTASSA